LPRQPSCQQALARGGPTQSMRAPIAHCMKWTALLLPQHPRIHRLLRKVGDTQGTRHALDRARGWLPVWSVLCAERTEYALAQTLRPRLARPLLLARSDVCREAVAMPAEPRRNVGVIRAAVWFARAAISIRNRVGLCLAREALLPPEHGPRDAKGGGSCCARRPS
jgi:hypothetical protein